MNKLTPKMIALLAVLAIALAGSMTPTAAAAQIGATPSVSYKNVVRTCYPLTVDGQKQEQCQADFTVVVKHLHRGDAIEVFATDEAHDSTYSVGSFRATGVRAKKRFKTQVVSYGQRKNPQYVSYSVVVTSKKGKTLLKSKPHRFE